MIDPAAPPWLLGVGEPFRRFQGSAVVVAVSGGGDSVGLLRALHSLGFRPSVAHLDHGARGEEGRADARFVADLADGLNLPFDLGHWTPTRPGHFEADARAARYGWLAEVATRRGARAVAVGQTLDDQAETILHRIVRGTGVGGLAGMAKVRRLAPGLALVRPLLGVSRREIRDYMAAIGQEFRDDSTNRDTSKTRARLRLDLLPRLARDYNPAVAEALVRLGRLASGSSRALARQVREWTRQVVVAAEADRITLDRPALARLGPFERAEVIRRAWRDAGWPERAMDDRRWRRLAALAIADRPTLSAGAKVEVTVSPDRITLVRSPRPPTSPRSAPVTLPIPGSAEWEGWRIEAILGADGPRDETVDRDRLSPPVVVRQAEPGDRFEPLGLAGRGQSLNDFFRGRRVERADRERVPIVSDRDGIVWVVGHRIAHRARVTEATRRPLGLRSERSATDSDNGSPPIR